MTNATLTRLSEERSAQETFISDLLAAAETETRDLVEAELRNVSAAETRIAEIDAQMAPLVAFETRRASAIQMPAVSGPSHSAPQFQNAEHRSLGEIWTESEQFRSYVGRGSSEALTIPLDQIMQVRATGPDPLLTTVKPGKDLLPSAYKFRGVERFAALPLLNLVGRVEVSSNTVEWVVTTDATGADEVAEGAQKPPVVWDTQTGTFTLKTVAGWFKYSRQAAEDIPALRDLVDGKIRRAVDVKLNALAVAALLGAKSAGNTTTGPAKAPMLEVIRMAMAEAESRGVLSTAVALNPADAASIDIALLGSTLGGAVVNNGVFGLQIVPVRDLTKGTAVVGDIGEAVQWFYRNTFSLYTTDSDITGDGATAKSDFRANILTTLGEVRGAFAATDVSALQFATVTP